MLILEQGGITAILLTSKQMLIDASRLVAKQLWIINHQSSHYKLPTLFSQTTINIELCLLTNKCRLKSLS